MFVHLSEGIDFFLFDHVGNPDEGLFVGVLFQEPVEHVVSDVDLAVGIPAGELGSGIVQNFSREFKPANFLGVLFPVLLSFGLGVGSFSANLVQIFGVFFHF